MAGPPFNTGEIKMAYQARYNENGFNLDQMQEIAPSVFAPGPRDTMSARYGFVPTVDVVEELTRRGLRPVYVGQTTSRDSERRPFAKHLIRFRPQYAPTIGGQSLPEVVLLNSHDGSSGFKLYMGLFRMVCMNGMIVADSVLGQVSVAHRANAAQVVGDRSIEFLSQVDHIEDKVQRFMDRVLTPVEQGHLAETAAQLRWGNDRPAGLDHNSLLIARRLEDSGDTAWRVLNRIQENVIKGGVSLGRSGRQSTTRVLRSVGDDARINAKLWEAADALL
jgi:hypothetical protein